MPELPTQPVKLVVPQRAMLWALFYGSALAADGLPNMSGNDEHAWMAQHAADCADEALKQFDKRFPGEAV